MTLTSDQLTRDLEEINYLLSTLRQRCGKDAIDGDDLRWLRARRKYVRKLLAIRRSQRRKKIVSLELWRDGRVNAPRADARVV